MTTAEWFNDEDPIPQLATLLNLTREVGVVVVVFADGSGGRPLSWNEIHPWTQTRAVTVADVAGDLARPGLDLALCCDLVYVREGSSLAVSAIEEPGTAAETWALARAGRAALARGLLVGGRMSGPDAVRFGLAHRVVAGGEPLPVPRNLSLAALTAARDLMRCRSGGTAGRALELATFRLLFAAGDPVEGARAFLEKRPPRFGGEGS
jgi:enoyl-CoA hydratase/carnithine racemase